MKISLSNSEHKITFDDLDVKSKSKVPALFLDRDGVIIEDENYISDASKVKLCSGALKLIKSANQAELAVIVVTNQSGISRGFFSWTDYEIVTRKILTLLGSSAKITAIYANGCSNKSIYKWWRKPNPGMLICAKEDYSIDLDKSILIGDRLTDLHAGARAGISTLVHVLSGHGLKERPNVLDIIQKEGNLNIENELFNSELILIDSLNEFLLDMYIK